MNSRILCAVTALGLAVPAVWAADKNDPGLATFQRFQGGPTTTSPAPAPADKAKSKSTDADKKPSDTAAALRAQEEANLLRRLAVCDKLRQIALEKGDTKLEDEAIRLEQKAEEVYRQRVQMLTARKPAPAKDGGDKK